MVNQTATINEINPTNTKKKYWKITIWLAKFLSFKIIGKIIPKSWSEWAKNVLGPDSPNTATNNKKDQSQNGQETPTPEVKIEKSNELEPEMEVVDDKLDHEVEAKKNQDEFIDEGLIILRKEVDELRSKASSQEALQSDIDELKTKLTEMRGQKEQLEQIIKEELPELRQATERLKEEFSKECERLEGEIKNLKEDLAKKEGEITGLRKQIEEKDAEISRLIALNKQLDEAKKEMEAKNNAQQQTISEKDETIRNLQESLQQKDDLIKELMDKGNTNEVVQQENGRLQRRKKELEGEVSKLQSDNNVKTGKVEQLKNDLATKAREVVTYNEQVGLLEEEKTALQQSNDALTKSLEEKQQELDQIKREKGEQVSSANNEIIRLQQELYELTAKLKRMEELKAELQDEKEENENLSNQLNTVREEKEGLNTQLNNKTQNFEQLTQHEHELKNKISELQKELAEEKVQHEAQLKDLKSQLSVAEKKKEELEKQITELKEEVQTLKRKNAESASAVKSLASQNEELQQENSKQKNELSQKTSAIVSYAKTHGEMGDEIRTLKKQAADKQKEEEMLVKQEEKIEALETQVTTLEGELQTANGKIKKLEEKNQASQNEKPKPQEQKEALELDAVSEGSTASGAQSNVLYHSKHSLIEHIFHGHCKSEHGALFDGIMSVKNAWRGTPFYQAMSKLNTQLKQTFPELQGHFCHKVIEETIISLISLSNKNGGRFESSQLIKLLESNFKDIAKKRIEPKIREVITEHNMLAGCITNSGTLEKENLLPFVKKCVEELKYNIESQFLDTLTKDCLQCFKMKMKMKKDSNSDRKELLKESVIKVLTDASANGVSNIVKEQKLAPKVGNEFLLLNQEICPEVKDKKNEYQFNHKFINKERGAPNSSMIRTNSEHSMSSTKTGGNNTVSRGLGIIGSMFK